MSLASWNSPAFADGMSSTPRTFYCKSHPDFHMPSHVEIGKGFDGERYVERLKAHGVDGVAIFGKCHYGFAYYPSAYGTVHPRLTKDMLAEVKRGCEAHQVRMIVYFSVFLDTAAIERHPDWRLQSSDERTDAGFDSNRYEPVCVNSPYLEELLIPQAVESIQRYAPEELFLDTMTGFHPCYCSHCLEAYGKAIPKGPEDEDWLEYVSWYRGCYDRFFRRVGEAVHAADPNVDLSINWLWGVRNPEGPPPHITRLSADLIATPLVASTVSRYFAGSGYPFDYMTGRFLSGLGDWSNNTADSLLITAATTASNGGSFYIIDRQLPDGSLEERSYEMMDAVFGFLHARDDVFDGIRHVPEIAVLHSYVQLMGDALQFYPLQDERTRRRNPYEGVSRLLMHYARHFTGLSLENCLARMTDYQVLIIPETEFLTNESVARFARYVDEGGHVLLALPTELENVPEALLEFAGVAPAEATDRQIGYGYLQTNATDPMLVRTNFANVVPLDGAEVLHQHIEPAGLDAEGKSFGHGFAPPGTPTKFAGVLHTRRGQGQVITTAFPAFSSYWEWRNPWLAKALLQALDRLLPEPCARLHTRAHVELVATRKANDLIVHLVNHSGREFLGGYYYPMTEYVPVIPDLKLSLHPNAAGKKLRLASSNEVLEPAMDGNRPQLLNLSLHYHEAVVVADFFA